MRIIRYSHSPVCPTLTYNAVQATLNVPFQTPNTSKHIIVIDTNHRIKFMNGVMFDGADLKRFSIYPAIIPISNQNGICYSYSNMNYEKICFHSNGLFACY